MLSKFADTLMEQRSGYGKKPLLRKGNMAQFDILRRHEDGSFIWLVAAPGIEIAKARMQELSAETPGNYFVFDQKSQQIVAKLCGGL
jgi:hypothetical protein